MNCVEKHRLAKLGEGRPKQVADALVPSSLRTLLECGPRGIQRAAQTMAYAEKWHRRSGLPQTLAPREGSYTPLPCLPRPLTVRTNQGLLLDRLNIRGPRASVSAISEPTIAIVGSTGDDYIGYCIAANSPDGPVLGEWLCIGQLQPGDISIEIGANKYIASTEIWADLIPPKLNPAEVFFLPPPMLRLPNNATAADKIIIETSFERLEINYEPEPIHPMVQ